LFVFFFFFFFFQIFSLENVPVKTSPPPFPPLVAAHRARDEFHTLFLREAEENDLMLVKERRRRLGGFYLQ